MASTVPPTEIGFLDVGNMGSLMAKHLLDKAAAAKQVKFFDAPVAGAEPAARAGTLVFMVGGDGSNVKKHKLYRLLMNDGQYKEKDISVMYKFLSKKN